MRQRNDYLFDINSAREKDRSSRDIALDQCRDSRCRHVTPGRSHVNRHMCLLLMGGLNLMLKATRNPDGLVDVGAKINRWMCGMRLKFQAVGTRVWPYLDGGLGEPVVLLHGFGADKDRFGAFIPRIRRSFRVVVPDIPGFGDHAKAWSAAYDIHAQVRRIEGFISAIGLDKCHLMGISLGGYMAAYFAARYPDRVKSLCLMDSAGFSSPIDSDALRLFRDKQRNIFLPNTGSQMQLLVDHLLYHRIKLPVTFRDHWVKQAQELLPWRRKLFEDLLSGGIDIMDDLARQITAPTLVVWGAEDRICHISTVDHIMARIAQCRAYVIHGCGHIPIFEYPALSSKIYTGFLGQVGRDF